MDMRKLSERRAVIEKLTEHFSAKFNGKVWAAWDEDKKQYSIRGESLPAHPDLQETYPNGWSLLDYIPTRKALEITGLNSFTGEAMKPDFANQLRNAAAIVEAAAKLLDRSEAPPCGECGKVHKHNFAEYQTAKELDAIALKLHKFAAKSQTQTGVLRQNAVKEVLERLP